MPETPRELAGELLALCLPARCVEGLPVHKALDPESSSRGGPACRSSHACPPPAENPSHAASPADSDETHWEALISQAIQQGVAPLVAVRSRGLSLPVAVRERLEALYRANALRNLRLAAEEARVSAALDSAGVRHWTLKGPGLSERLYGDIGVRQISDLDFLIEPANLAQTDALLAELGFRRQTAGRIDSLSAAQELLYVREAGTARGTTNRATVPPAAFLDLHQRLLPYVRRDALSARVFREGLTPENLLLYLCANQITHRFARLRYLADVSAFLDREAATLDWDCFLRSARALPWGPGVGLALRWASQFSNSPAPEHVLHGLKANPIGDLLLRRTLGASAAEAASRARLLDSSAGAAVPLAAAYLGRPSAYGIAWNLLLPSRAYLREQTGAPADQPLSPAYAARLLQKIPTAIRHLLQPQR